jgi:putative ATP-binding cassette transporter
LRIANKLRNTDLTFIEEHDKATLFRPFTEESNIISYAASVLVNGGQTIVLLVMTSIYFIYLSPLSFFVSSVFIFFAVVHYLSNHKKITDKLQGSYRKELEVFKLFNHLLDGFKELKINQNKSDDLFSDIEQLSAANCDLKISAGLNNILQSMYSQIVFYCLLMILVFIIPLYSKEYFEIIFKVTATVLFIMGPINSLVSSIPILAQVNVSIEEIYRLEERLDRLIANKNNIMAQPIESFSEVKLNQVEFEYTDSYGICLFAVGPLNLTIKNNEMLYIIGGNGSGKSTLLKLLCGLYYPEHGCIQVDDEIINGTNYQYYRELFSIIFTDFHLFDKLYGLKDVDESKLKNLLKLMELDQKTKYINGSFTNLNLSTGQKKRLAFIVAILENKPICIFDELAADQDPEFRRNFYEVILPELKQQGRTIIAVTHDDKYFHTADRILKMDYGKLTEFNG